VFFFFEIESGRITVPIGLSYHGSGIKVDEIASRTGIGWVLNTGGVVTRTVKGYADEITPVGMSNIKGYFLSGGQVANAGEYGTTDFEPDEYFYRLKRGALYLTVMEDLNTSIP